jgi:prepilin-type N-terminal cleavage/methylation domain-containing protein
MKNNSGFTLVEILIAVVILAIISTLTSVNISKSVKFKNKVEQEMDDYAAVRDALVIITHDINTAFHWIDLNAEMKKQIANASPTGPAAPTPGLQITNNSNAILPEKLTSFDGDAESLYLTTLSHVRTVMDTKESDQAKIGYFIKTVKALHGGESVKALVRSESPILDGEEKKGGIETVLLENIKSLKFRYMGGDDKEWLETWKSSEGLDTAIRGKFPDAVEITITTVRKGREISLSTMATIHNTFNDLLANLNPSANPSGSPTASPTPANGNGTNPAPNPITKPGGP